EANLCLCVSQALHSWVPAWISCYFSPQFTLKKKQHSFQFLPSKVLIYMKLSNVMTFNANNATFIILLLLEHVIPSKSETEQHGNREKPLDVQSAVWYVI
ncbi:unnamed protein product, partial [Bubo scandiacus]